MSWAEVKHALNASIGTDDFKPLDELIKTSIQQTIFSISKLSVGSIVTESSDVLYTPISSERTVSGCMKTEHAKIASVRLGASYPVAGKIRISISARFDTFNGSDWTNRTRIYIKDSSETIIGELSQLPTSYTTKTVDVKIPEDGILNIYGGNDYSDDIYLTCYVNNLSLCGIETFPTDSNPLGIALSQTAE